MSNRSILHYAANLNIDSLGQAQTAPMVPSFTNYDNDYGSESSFYPSHGATGNFFSSNANKADIEDKYLVSPGGVWNGNQNDGFIVEKNSADMVEFNLAIVGSPGHWIPAPMLKGFCFQELYATAYNSNWRVRRLALKFRNWNTNTIRTYAPDWDNAQQAQNKYVFRNMSSQTHWNVIRSWGPEWSLYGAVFNYKSNSTSAVQKPKHHLFGVRVAWQTTGLTGTTKWMPFKFQSWTKFTAEMQAGTPQFHHQSP